MLLTPAALARQSHRHRSVSHSSPGDIGGLCGAKTLFLPYFQARDPSYTKERAIADAGLHPIEIYLRSTQKITLITNQDDIILAPTELAWLRQVFQDRSVIFDDGGHCGNYQRADVLAAISRLLAE